MKSVLVIVGLCFAFVLIFGCTESNEFGIPPTASVITSIATDENVSQFLAGDNNGELVYVDGNKFGFISPSDLNISGGGGFSNPATENLNMNSYNITDVNSIYGKYFWNDSNKDYGILYCTDGNIVVGYIEGFSC